MAGLAFLFIRVGFWGFCLLDVLEGILVDWYELYSYALLGLSFGLENAGIAHQSLLLIFFVFLCHVVAFDDHVHVGVLASEKENAAVGIQHGAHFIFDLLFVFWVN